MLSFSSIKGPFKYYVIKEVGGWGQKMAILDDLQYCNHQRVGWVGLKKSKTWWPNTWMVPNPKCDRVWFDWNSMFCVQHPQSEWASVLIFFALGHKLINIHPVFSDYQMPLYLHLKTSNELECFK